MITLLRSLIALALAGVLTVLTLGRVHLNRTGKSTATDDDGAGGRPAAAQPIGEEEREGREGDPPRGGTPS